MIMCTIKVCGSTPLFDMILKTNIQENPMRLRLHKQQTTSLLSPLLLPINTLVMGLSTVIIGFNLHFKNDICDQESNLYIIFSILSLIFPATMKTSHPSRHTCIYYAHLGASRQEANFTQIPSNIRSWPNGYILPIIQSCHSSIVPA